MNRAHLLKLALTFALALVCTTARAHDPLDITAQARLLPGGIELRVTLASSTAHRLLTAGKSGADIRPEEFERLRPELKLLAPDFLRVAANGQTLAPKSISTELTLDGDVRLLLQFPPSSAPRFQFNAALLQKLPDLGYTVLLFVRGASDGQAAQERMSRDKPDCEFAAFPR